MNDVFVEVGLALILFTSTNIDDVFVLLTFFSDRRFQAREVIAGQYAGITILTVGSILLSLFLKTIPGGYVGILGLIPLGIGIKKLFEKDQADDDEVPGSSAGRFGRLISVAAVTTANGGDNVGVYVPLFATKPIGTLIMYLALFVFLTAVWCRLALYLINHRSIGAHFRRFSPPLVPWVFIGLGIYILYESDSMSLLRDLI
jgi:cadmium resistance transport/sequestration family protein